MKTKTNTVVWSIWVKKLTPRLDLVKIARQATRNRLHRLERQ